MEYFAFQWHITDSCDQRCQHCYIFSENLHIKLKEMSWTEIESVFANCLQMCEEAGRLPLLLHNRRRSDPAQSFLGLDGNVQSPPDCV